MSGDDISTVALLLLTLYGLLTLGGRALLQRRSAADSGWRGISGAVGSPAWCGGVMLAAATLALPFTALLFPAVSMPSATRLVAGGLGFGVGFVLTVYAQHAMGSSWRVGVRAGERTALRTQGPFRWCRNPVFASMLLSVAALVLWIPALAAPWLLMFAALELQVRVVEEPHLLEVHGDAYRAYAIRTGRFVPGLGRLR
ncbi:MAG: isoprenylcysteine carboxylmethyltransferase family protein [Myxococcota bacterium]